MDLAELNGLLARGEGQFFDWKSARIDPRDLAPHLVAFANADGGTLAVGVEDDETITGVKHHAGKINELVQAGTVYCTPPVRTQHELVDCVNRRGEPDQVLVLHVPQSDRVHATSKDEVFLRIGDQSRKLKLEERLELLYDKGATNFEVTIADGATFEDLDAELLEEYRGVLGVRSSSEDLLVGRGLAARKAAGLAINYAGVLLFAKEPTRWLPRAEVRFLRYEGTTAETGTRVDRMYEEMTAAKLPPPDFRDREYHVVVTLRNDLEARRAERRPEVGVSERLVDVAADVARKLNDRQVAALRFLRTHDRIETADLMRMFPGVPERTARRDLGGLVALGLLERHGRTRGAYYHTGGVIYRLDDQD
jgi:predicted HTH transcriptional regulator